MAENPSGNLSRPLHQEQHVAQDVPAIVLEPRRDVRAGVERGARETIDELPASGAILRAGEDVEKRLEPFRRHEREEAVEARLVHRLAIDERRQTGRADELRDERVRDAVAAGRPRLEELEDGADVARRHELVDGPLDGRPVAADLECNLDDAERVRGVVGERVANDRTIRVGGSATRGAAGRESSARGSDP